VQKYESAKVRKWRTKKVAIAVIDTETLIQLVLRTWPRYGLRSRRNELEHDLSSPNFKPEFNLSFSLSFNLGFHPSFET
jgi:hypothetical protein